MSTWTDELKAKAIEMYQEQEPNGENSMDIVNDIAEQLEQSPNGVRMILSKAGVYVTKTAPAKKAAGGAKATGGTRVSKEAAQDSLREAITAVGGTVEEDIVTKLTGKAAVYFADILKKLA